jgi:hypothetical protein
MSSCAQKICSERVAMPLDVAHISAILGRLQAFHLINNVFANVSKLKPSVWTAFVDEFAKLGVSVGERSSVGLASALLGLPHKTMRRVVQEYKEDYVKFGVPSRSALFKHSTFFKQCARSPVWRSPWQIGFGARNSCFIINTFKNGVNLDWSVWPTS